MRTQLRKAQAGREELLGGNMTGAQEPESVSTVNERSADSRVGENP